MTQKFSAKMHELLSVENDNLMSYRRFPLLNRRLGSDAVIDTCTHSHAIKSTVTITSSNIIAIITIIVITIIIIILIIILILIFILILIIMTTIITTTTTIIIIIVIVVAIRQLCERSKPKKQSRFAIAGFLGKALRSESAFSLHGDGQSGERSLQRSRLLGPACVAGSEVCRRHGSSGGPWGGRSLPGSGPRAHLSKDGEAMCLWSSGQQRVALVAFHRARTG